MVGFPSRRVDLCVTVLISTGQLASRVAFVLIGFTLVSLSRARIRATETEGDDHWPPHGGPVGGQRVGHDTHTRVARLQAQPARDLPRGPGAGQVLDHPGPKHRISIDPPDLAPRPTPFGPHVRAHGSVTASPGRVTATLTPHHRPVPADQLTNHRIRQALFEPDSDLRPITERQHPAPHQQPLHDHECCLDAMTLPGSAGRFWSYRGLRRELAIRQVTPRVGIVTGPRLLVHLIWPPNGGPALCESGGAGVVGVEFLVGGWGDHPEAAVAAGAVLEDFDPVEDLGGQFGASAPLAGVQQLGLHASPEGLDHGVVEAGTSPRTPRPRSSSTFPVRWAPTGTPTAAPCW